MWTSTILFILSMFTQAGEVEQAVRAHVAEFQIAEAAAAAQPAKAIAKRPAKKRAVKPAAVKAPKTKAPVQELATPTPAIAVAGLIKVAPPTAEAIVGKVQDFYNNTKSFTASFSQTVTNSTFSKLKPKTSAGKVYILKPGKMRWDYKNKSYRSKTDPKVSKSFISDGKYLWAVMHKNKQYYKEALSGSALPVAVSFLMGTGDLLTEFNVSLETSGKYGSKSDILLLLTPKTPSARYKKLWLVVDSTQYSVKQSIVLNTKGDTNSIVFSNVALNTGKLRKGHFLFNADANKDYRLITPPK